MSRRHKASTGGSKRQASAAKEGRAADPLSRADANPEPQNLTLGKVIQFIYLIDLFTKGNDKNLHTKALDLGLFLPPKLAEFALYMILSKEDREYLIGDLAEEYLEVLAKFGRRKACVWYYKQVLTSIWPLLRKVVGVGLLAWFGEWIRRRI